MFISSSNRGPSQHASGVDVPVQRGGGEPSLITGITRQIMQDYSVEPRRVYVGGLSAGAAAAAIMGSTYGDLYAPIGDTFRTGLRGRHGPSLRAARHEARRRARGSAERWAGYSDQGASRAGAGHAYTRTVHTDAAGRGILEHWEIHGAGHAWSGGSPAGS
ncbi:poly(3-hydroxybutyrate) depolymerase [Bradyrhizobium sp. LB7.2]